MNNSSEGRIEPSHSTRVSEKDIKSDADLLPRCVTAMAHVISNARPTSTEAGNNSHYVVPRDAITALGNLHKEIAKSLWGNTRAHTPAVGDAAQQARALVKETKELWQDGSLPIDIERDLVFRVTTLIQAAAAERDAELKLERDYSGNLREQVEDNKYQLATLRKERDAALTAAASAREAERLRIATAINNVPFAAVIGNGLGALKREVLAAIEE